MKKEYILLFLGLFIFCLPNIVNLCKSYPILSYDNQIFLTWQYAASNGQIPYRDIFFPYGLLSFYKGLHLAFSTIYLLLAPILFLFIFFILQKIFKDRLFSYLALICLFLFIALFTGFELFTRYGVLIVITCLYAFILYTYKNNVGKKIFIVGALNGIILALYNDVGVYAFLSFYGLLIADVFLRYRTKAFKHAYSVTIKGLLFLIGFVLGIIPFCIYLIQNNSLAQFFKSVWELRDLAQFAKTPFFHSFTTIDNLFTFLLLVLTIFSLSYKIFFKQHKSSLTSYIQIGLVFALLILEQKNIIRNIDIQLTFVGLLLFFILFNEIKDSLAKNNMSRTNIVVYFINLTVIIVFLLGLHTSEPVRFVIPCSASDTRSILSQAKDIGSYEDTKKEFEKSFGPNTKMFTYPGDTIFYVLFNQQMPYYPTIYEASSAEAQNVLVRYIVKNKIDHIIYNYKNTSIQDEVPNYIRATLLHRYILNNFSITKRKDNYLFLERTSKQEDFFKSNNFSGIIDFRNSLLTVNMESIPRTEGIYKSNYLYSDNSRLVKVSSSIGEVNRFLHSNNINSQHTFITIEFSEGSKKEKSTIKIKTKDNLTTSVTFNQCDNNKPCIIHLDNIPLFYRNRIIEDIQTESGDPIKNINIFTISNNIYFW